MKRIVESFEEFSGNYYNNNIQKFKDLVWDFIIKFKEFNQNERSDKFYKISKIANDILNDKRISKEELLYFLNVSKLIIFK